MDFNIFMENLKVKIFWNVHNTQKYIILLQYSVSRTNHGLGPSLLICVYKNTLPGNEESW